MVANPPPPLEMRLELYSDGSLEATVSQAISDLLAKRWPVTWDVHIPPQPSFESPARWHAVVPPMEGETAQLLHEKVSAEVLGLDPTHTLHFRTRWDYPQTPNEQEIYEVRWKPDQK